ncbi:PDZ domain-containing protein [Leifsonia sp. A12D58]|uniref:YlbL family protein n=1 Tax=Leifsonia sp. A12D58 TaxID=3397674 RepID=UPI0039E008F5
MALFDDGPVSPVRPRSTGRRVGWIVLGVALAIALILALMPAPYVIEKPGPVFNTLGSTKDAEGVETPLISIPDQTVYPTKGSLDMLTVTMLGNRESRPSWLNILSAWMSPSEAVIPLDDAFPPNVTTEQQQQQSQIAMVDSQQDAIAAALTNLGYTFPAFVTVASLPTDSPADGILKPDDQIVSVNGTAIASVDELRAALAASGAGKPASIGIIRDGASMTVDVTPVDIDGTVVAGINVSTTYEFPFEVKIQLDRVGGPSAGMMFALGIIDKLTPGPLQGGETVAGTGTIDESGTVGPIGGIRQKMYGAVDAGADWFLAPADNCSEVTGHIPDGLEVFAVSTLDESLAVLDAINTGADTSSLPTCPVG